MGKARCAMVDGEGLNVQSRADGRGRWVRVDMQEWMGKGRWTRAEGARADGQGQIGKGRLTRADGEGQTGKGRAARVPAASGHPWTGPEPGCTPAPSAASCGAPAAAWRAPSPPWQS